MVIGHANTNSSTNKLENDFFVLLHSARPLSALLIVHYVLLCTVRCFLHLYCIVFCVRVRAPYVYIQVHLLASLMLRKSCKPKQQEKNTQEPDGERGVENKKDFPFGLSFTIYSKWLDSAKIQARAVCPFSKGKWEKKNTKQNRMRERSKKQLHTLPKYCGSDKCRFNLFLIQL